MNLDLIPRMEKVCHLLYKKGYVEETAGNVSYRFSERSIIITSTGISLRDADSENLSWIDYKGNVESGPKPSSESRLHLSIYKARPEINSVIHTHPMDVLLFFNRFDSFQSTKLFEQYYDKPISAIPYLKPGSIELANRIAKEVKKTDVIILRGHGLVTIGKSFVNAFDLSERIINQSTYELHNFEIKTLESIHQMLLKLLEYMKTQ